MKAFCYEIFDISSIAIVSLCCPSFLSPFAQDAPVFSTARACSPDQSLAAVETRSLSVRAQTPFWLVPETEKIRALAAFPDNSRTWKMTWTSQEFIINTTPWLFHDNTAKQGTWSSLAPTIANLHGCHAGRRSCRND